MKAVVFHQHGGPEVLSYEDRPEPEIGPGDVLVRLKAAALNHLDIWVRQGIPAYATPLPHISGSDGAGVVERVGSAVSDIPVGMRVFIAPGLSCWRCEYCLSGRDNMCVQYHVVGAHVDGTYAEYVCVPSVNVLPIPDGITFEEAAAFPLVGLTAWHMLFTLGAVRPGETVLVIGAGSGVGSMAVQLAGVAGARVITTVGRDEKIPNARALGAADVINHSTEDIPARVKQSTEGRGVDLVIEHVGPTVWQSCLASLAKGGRLVTCGATTGPEVRFDVRYLFSRQLKVNGSYLGPRVELVHAARVLGQRKVKAVIDRVFALAEARAAQEAMLGRRFFGKLVLAIH